MENELPLTCAKCGKSITSTECKIATRDDKDNEIILIVCYTCYHNHHAIMPLD